MAQIYDRGNVWELDIFPGLAPVEILDEPSKGYRAVLSLDPATQRHVVAKVTYNKDMYTIEDVLKKVESLRTCEACDTLDRDRLRLESITVPSAGPLPVAPVIQSPPPISVPAVAPLSQQAPPNVKDMFANIVMDAYLTDPGKYFLGLMLDDQTLLESAYPTDPKNTPAFMEDMIDFMSGKVEFMRSPEEAREFLSVMREGTEEDARSISPADKRRLPSAMGNIVIY
ncbi:MAG: hypothetical protein ACTSPB_16320 [Candidatus Thorarchaeota archaeon]